MQACAADETLEGLLAERLTEDETVPLCRHLERCERCRGRLDQLSDHSQLRRWRVEVGHRPTPLPHDPRLVDLLAALREAPLLESTSAPSPGDANDGELGFLGPPAQDGDLGTLGPYRILAEIGRGGMGIVFKAHDAALDRKVAVKVLRPGRGDSRARARFVREAQAAARVKHDHIVSVYAVGNPADGPPFLVMEYLAGPSLAELIQNQQRLEPRQAAALATQVADGLAAAHAAGLTHRDIKPANVMLEGPEQGTGPLESQVLSPVPGRAKIMDFGLARLAALPSSVTQQGAVVGTPAYMSPEQARGEDSLDPRTDIYGLGVTLYEMLTGDVPFRGAPHMVLRQVIDSEPAPPRRLNDAIPPDLETIALKAMAKEPHRRYQTAQAIADDLRCWLNGEPIVARPAGTIERLWRWCRRKPVVASLTAALVLVLALGFGGVAWQWRRAEGNAARAKAKADEAERGFRRAREAVDKYLTEVTDNRDLKALHFEPLRRELLQTAKEFYERFVEENPDNPDLRAELGKAHGRLGTITRILESPAKALAPFQKSVEVFEHLHEEYPDSLSYLHDLAFFQVQLGSCHAAIFQLEDAETAYRSAQALWEQLIAAEPQEDTRYQLARTFTALADLYREAKRMSEAERLYLDARGILARLAAEHPAEAKFPAGLAQNQTNLGTLYLRTGQTEKEKAALDEAFAIQDGLVRAHPDVPDYKSDLIYNLVNLGISYSHARQPDQMETVWKRGYRLGEELVAAHPANLEYQYQLTRMCNNLGAFLYFERQRVEEATAILRKGLDSARRLNHAYPRVQDYLASYCNISLNLGRLKLETDQPAEAVDLYGGALERMEAAGVFQDRGEDTQNWIGQYCSGRAEAFFQAGRYEDAIKDYEEAASRRVPAERQRWLLFRDLVKAMQIVEAQDPIRAAAAAEELSKQAPRDDGYLAVAAARVFARCAAASRLDKKRPASEREQLAGQYADRAMQLLRQASDGGLFARRTMLSGLKTCSDFEALRSRPDFQQFVAPPIPRPAPDGAAP
jgi:tetratricopeptide (TPR) repeat protein/tRNA A-37 threonylcarbamoyl transferase component Bud32